MNFSKISNIYLQSVALQINVCLKGILNLSKSRKKWVKNLRYLLLSVLMYSGFAYGKTLRETNSKNTAM